MVPEKPLSLFGIFRKYCVCVVFFLKYITWFFEGMFLRLSNENRENFEGVGSLSHSSQYPMAHLGDPSHIIECLCGHVLQLCALEPVTGYRQLPLSTEG